MEDIHQRKLETGFLERNLDGTNTERNWRKAQNQQKEGLQVRQQATTPPSEAIKIKSMATTGAHLPVIGSLQVTYAEKEDPETPKNDEEKGEEEKKEQSNVANLTKAASFLAGLELGTLRRVNQPRPGDVYHRPQTMSLAKQPRPLGLLPDRGTRLNALRELTKILSPAPLPVSVPKPELIRRAGRRGGGGRGDEIAHPNSAHQDKEDANDGASDIHLRDDLISAAVSGKPSNASASKPSVSSNSPERSFRLPKKDDIESITYQIPESHCTPLPFKDQTDDREYMDTLAKCNIKEYGLSESRIPAGMRRTRTLPGASLHGYSSSNKIPAVQLSPGKKKAKCGRYIQLNNLEKEGYYFMCNFFILLC